MTAASGLFSCSHCLTGANASKIGAHTGSSRLFLSCANPMVGVCEHATAPMMLAMSPYSCVRSVEGHGLARKTRGAMFLNMRHGRHLTSKSYGAPHAGGARHQPAALARAVRGGGCRQHCARSRQPLPRVFRCRALHLGAR